MPRPILREDGWPGQAFQGDQLNLIFQGYNLAQATAISVRPAKGIVAELGEATSDSERTATLKISFDAYPGDKRVWLESPEGESNQLLLIVLM
ncbi:hypothetical protein [Leptolyngbya sp. FACHB-261]|uniref:hypothetical protein n=1 Tax=Leptolyngbya sp. FACHB-261 TaxID=2692806 RepID=UPI001686F326|nr:hypothetical protein [Leptolyngbya sp. FACHB-261]MBD2101303.1 hypothetical protein [Leptolyngbya sp. FACHB-261]